MHKSALSRWEAGSRQPRVTELEATLSALRVSAAESARAFACIPASRALRHLKSRLAPMVSSPLTQGDLLRALRLRKGWTQAQAAGQIGVSPQALARWEHSDRLPSSEQLHALCYALEAHEEELIALTTGRFAASQDQEIRAWEETAEAPLDSLTEALLRIESLPLPELSYHLLDQALWRRSLHDAAARQWLMRLRTHHAQFHRLYLRWELVRPLLAKAREAVTESEMEPEYRLRQIILAARLAVFGGHRPAPERGIRLLRSWVESSRALPAFHAWILSDIAKYATMLRAFESALSLAEQACVAAESSDDWIELWLRQCDYGTLLVKAGRAGGALKTLPDPYASEWKGVRLASDGSLEHGRAYLAWAEAHFALGHLETAQDALSWALEKLETTGWPEDKQRAAALAARFETR